MRRCTTPSPRLQEQRKAAYRKWYTNMMSNPEAHQQYLKRKSERSKINYNLKHKKIKTDE